MGRTNIDIDDELIERALEVTQARSKREAVDIALRRLLQRAEAYQGLRALGGRAEWIGDLDSWRRSRQ